MSTLHNPQTKRLNGKASPASFFLQGISVERSLLDVASDEGLMMVLSQEGLNTPASGDVAVFPSTPAMQREKQQRVYGQLKELVEQYRFKRLVSIFGLPQESSSSLEVWLYPMLAHALRQLFQCEGVHLYASEVAPEDGRRHLVMTASTSLPLDEKLPPTHSFPEIVAPAARQDCPLLDWFCVGHSAPKLLPLEGPLHLLHPDEHAAFDEAALLVRYNINYGKGEGLLVLTGKQATFEREMFQHLVQKAAMLLGCCERLENRGRQLLELVADEASAKQHALDDADFRQLRNELNRDILQYTELQQQFLITMAQLIDERMALEPGSAERVGNLLIAMGNELALNEKTIDAMVKAALFMQVLKLHVQEFKLAQPHDWDDDDFQAYYASSQAAMRVLNSLYSLGDSLPFLQHALEQWDGAGFPGKLKGRNIPLGSRMIALAQAYVSMREPKPYREKGMSKRDTLKQVEDEAGTKWDPELVALLKRSVRDQA